MENNSSLSIGFTGILFFIFLVLKLCGTIDWSWWWVTSPLWIILLIKIILIIAIAIVAANKERRDRYKSCRVTGRKENLYDYIERF